MSTDDSVSEDVSTSAALSHNNADASGGKESEASAVSSEDTLSGPAGPEEEQDRVRSVRALRGFFQSATGSVTGRSPPTPASGSPHKSRSLCFGPEEFGSGRSLPSINPSPLETLSALVQEIRKGGETDPELWKDSEGRWLHLFKLVEKQYQEQILTQQEQYQCQIQLIQDEIKALVQLQNRPIATQSADDTPAQTPGDSPLSDPAPLAPLSSATGSANPQEFHRERAGPAVTGSCQELPELSLCGGEGGCGGGGTDEQWRLHPFPPVHSTTAPPLAEEKQADPQPPSGSLPSLPSLPADQSETSSRLLTTWAQRERRRGRRRRSAREPREEAREEALEERAFEGSAQAGRLENFRSLAQPPQPFYLQQWDPPECPASGLTFWRSEEKELFCPRLDTLDRGTSRFVQEAPVDLCSPEQARLSVPLREIYRRRQRETRSHDWSSSFSSKTSLTQVEVLHTAAQVRQPRPSFTSPFRFSSPSFPTQSQPSPPGGAPVTQESAPEGPGPCHTDGSLRTLLHGTSHPGLASMAVVSPATSPTGGRGACGGAHGTPHSQEEAGHPKPPPRADPWRPPSLQNSPSLEDPVVLSLARQSVREKNSRHIADLRAYYESEISVLKEQLSLANRPPGSEEKETNQILRDRCEHLERSVVETKSRARELEEQNLRLGRQLCEWQERYDSASATVTALQQRLEAANRSRREKEEAANWSEREKEEAGEQLRGRLSQLEGAYLQAYRLSDHQDAYRKQENRVLQDLLADYETLEKDHGRVKDKLVSTEDKLFDAIAQISELKRVVSKLESQVKQLEHENLRSRHLPHSHPQPSGAGLYHHPDLLLSPSRSQADLETSSRKWTDPGQPLDQTAANTTRHYSSPEKEEIWGGSRAGRTPQEGNPPGSADESFDCDGGEEIHRGRGPPQAGPPGPLLQPQRICPSVIISARRDKLMAPPPDKSSPKRCPSENFSTAFGPAPSGPAPSWQRHSHSWSDVRLDQRGLMSSSPSHSSNAKKRLQCSGEPEANHQPSNGKGGVASGEDPIEQGAEGKEAGPPRPSAAPLSYQDRLQALPDTERLFDQLTLEKQQIEAALSRIPNTAGGRITLQAKIEEEALEARLESVNRELGSIRMTLKKFHVLRSSANI
ncbi:M-phase phosphoprotein 9-like [Anguilla anguilla]|uniref:M-phase phosphoprotein 9-like n=1 Tax=Anguilla anguilla TaxID=7936 RepID=UPI0015AFB8C9|nr:M-phase phosphoprotein 9-like [Anguilla anguilla]